MDLSRQFLVLLCLTSWACEAPPSVPSGATEVPETVVEAEESKRPKNRKYNDLTLRSEFQPTAATLIYPEKPSALVFFGGGGVEGTDQPLHVVTCAEQFPQLREKQEMWAYDSSTTDGRPILVVEFEKYPITGMMCGFGIAPLHLIDWDGDDVIRNPAQAA